MSLLRQTWDADPSVRPDFDWIANQLAEVLCEWVFVIVRGFDVYTLAFVWIAVVANATSYQNMCQRILLNLKSLIWLLGRLPWLLTVVSFESHLQHAPNPQTGKLE